jgi:hypothetical protein
VSGISQARFIGLAIIPPAVGWWYIRSKSQVFKMEELVIITLLLSMLFSPFAWSFDAILLLIPLTQLIAWAVEGYLNLQATLMLLAVFAIANGVALYQRTLEVQDWVFFWFPLVMMVLYAGGWWLSTQKQSSGART